MTTGTDSETATEMADTMTVSHLGADRFEVSIRGHTITIDQPTDTGGEDTAPTPTELFIAGLASCVAFYARRYLARHDLDATGLQVSARFAMGGKPNRVTDIAIQIAPPFGLPEARRAALLAVASHCTVHNTLERPPAVQITFAASP
ncbi:MAG: OsmC family protein [Actinomycetota bacterium]|nr:OsmC family protein [Actinomycetota bacterium]